MTANQSPASLRAGPLGDFIRAGSGKIDLPADVVEQIVSRAKFETDDSLTKSPKDSVSLYASPAATQALLDDKFVDLVEWLIDETVPAVSDQASVAFDGDWSAVSGSVMRDPYSAKPYVLFYVEIEAVAAWNNRATPTPSQVGKGARDAVERIFESLILEAGEIAAQHGTTTTQRVAAGLKLAALRDPAINAVLSALHSTVEPEDLGSNRLGDLPTEGPQAAVVAARDALVLAIAFINRDIGTERITGTLNSLLPKLVAAEAGLRGDA